MYEYKIEVVREGKWWMVHIPEIDGLTQARRLSEAATMAREYIALDQNVPYEEIKVETASVRMEQPEFRELLDGAREIADTRAAARVLEDRISKMLREYCQWLTTYGVPVRDVAKLLEISPQRVSQLANDQGD